MKIIYTIVLNYSSVTVISGRLKNSRPYAHGGNVEVRTLGAIGKKIDTVNYHAMQCAIENGVPLTQFYRNGR